MKLNNISRIRCVQKITQAPGMSCYKSQFFRRESFKIFCTTTHERQFSESFAEIRVTCSLLADSIALEESSPGSSSSTDSFPRGTPACDEDADLQPDL